MLSLVGFLKLCLATMLTSFGRATITFLSLPNLKLSAFTSSAYRLMVYGSLRPARTFFKFQVIMKGPVAVIIDVSIDSTPVLNRAGVKESGDFVSCWNCATCDGCSPRRRGWGFESLENDRSTPSLPSYFSSFWSASIRRRYVRQVASTERPSAETSKPMID